MTNTLDYSLLIDQAMRGVVRDVLRDASKQGLPGEHHFYISFRTDHPGARISDNLRARYPRDITIVIQHQFWDFKVEDDKFHVTLSFGGVPEKITVPYAAMIAFADPSVKFGLQFQQSAQDVLPQALESLPRFEDEEADDEPEEDAGPAEIISLDAFRKK